MIRLFFLLLLLSSFSVKTLGATYVFPVSPRHTILYSPLHHTYPAVDIFAPEGYNFLAITDGIVDVVCRTDTWIPTQNEASTRGGLAVAIIGDDGLRYYGSHLLSISPGITEGVRVKAGQVLGKIGDTGNAKPECPQLHFGISRPTFPTDWKIRRGEISPYLFLVLLDPISTSLPR